MANLALADLILGANDNGTELVLDLALKLKLAKDNDGNIKPGDFSAADPLIIVASRLLKGGNIDNVQEDLIRDRVDDALFACLKRLVSSTGCDDFEVLAKDFANLCGRSSKLLGSGISNRVIHFCADILQNYIRDHYDSEQFLQWRFEVYEPFMTLVIDHSNIPEDGIVRYNEESVTFALSFIRHVLWQEHTKIGVRNDLVWLLIALISITYDDLASKSKDAILMLISSPLGSAQVITDKQGADCLWSSVLALARCRKVVAQRTIALEIWLTILDSRPEWLRLSGIYHEAEYWSLLQDELATGTQQQRKLSLTILRASILAIEEDVKCSKMTFRALEKAGLLERYEKYATVFVTVVINRYANQVQDALEQLLSLFRLESGIATPWLVSLLTAALDKSMQDSVRKIFGNLVMDHAAELLARDNAHAGLYLGRHFLPWAVNGSLFVSTLQRSGFSITCQHGTKLSDFVKSVILVAADDGTRNSIIFTILQYLSEHNDHAFPYAKAYILEGISMSLNARPITLDEASAMLMSRIISQGGYLEIVGHWVSSTIANLSNFVVQDAFDTYLSRFKIEVQETALNGITRLQDPDACANILAARSSEEAAGNPTSVIANFSVSQFCEWLRLSSHACLAQNGLVAGCIYLREAFGHPPYKPGEVLQSLDALWEELEIQEFDRGALMAFPEVLLHRTCLELCRSDGEMLKFVSEKLKTLQDLSQYRMHLFSALANMLRRVVLHDANASCLPLDDVIVSFVTRPPVTKAEFQFEHIFSVKLAKLVPKVSYEVFYGNSEGRAYANFFDMLNNTPDSDELSLLYSKALDALLLPWVQQKHPVPMVSKWKNTVQLQVMIILLQRRLPRCTPDETAKYFSTILGMLAVEPLPRFRFLLEWSIARISVLDKPRIELLDFMRSMDASNPKLCVSLVKVALGLACMQSTDEDFATEFMTQLVVLSASPKVAIRHEGQWSVPILWDHAQRKNWHSIIQNPAAARLNAWLRTLEPYKNPPAYRMLEQFDPIAGHNLSNLLDGDYLTLEPTEASRTNYAEFLALYEEDATPLIDSRFRQQAGPLPLGQPKRTRADYILDARLLEVEGSVESSLVSGPLQTKGNTWRAEIDALLGRLPSSGTGRRCRDLIVVASLIDNAYNVGGLSRAAEIFGAASLVVNDERVLKNKDFKSVAVSSELWLPIEQVPAEVNTLIPWLTSKRIQGYKVVGIEQTDDSHVLGAASLVLPKKLVLVLGSEREGIPARVLQACDWCVEVPQRGVTRSMNVQTAAAVVLYEYERQYRAQIVQ